MKIGTKANEIDKIGKVDTSNMKIKVNNKQIYPQKRYAIVRVECPPRNEIDAQFVCFPNDNNCSGCQYGDTKEQLIKKVAQILFKEKIKQFVKVFGKDFLDKKWKQIYSKEAYEEATKIVEFLGVEE